MKPKILVCVGTRADTIKMTPVYLALKRAGWAEVTLLNCGQHRELAASVLSFFSVRADFTFDVMRRGQSPEAIVDRVREESAHLLSGHTFDLALVHGDTASSLGAALACYDASLPVAHIEAGLRSGDDTSPYPEEIYRKKITSVASYHFAPTARARENLLSEGVEENRIYTVGNTVIDALRHALSAIPEDGVEGGGRYILLTLHRRENLALTGEDTAAERVFSAVNDLLGACRDLRVIFPIHKSERVRELFSRLPGRSGRFVVCEPMDYPAFVRAMRGAEFIISDSGGVTEEAAYLGIPVMIVRDNTEREESILGGCALLCGTDRAGVYRTAHRLYTDTEYRRGLAHPSDIYGDGHSSEMIEGILHRLCGGMQ